MRNKFDILKFNTSSKKKKCDHDAYLDTSEGFHK